MCFPNMTGAAASSRGRSLAAVHAFLRHRVEQNLRQDAERGGRKDWQWAHRRTPVDWQGSSAFAFDFRGLAFIVGVWV
jgi:hypothetical protein